MTDLQKLRLPIRNALIKEHKHLFTFLTGAGISAASGIPTYRGIDGIWVKGTKFYKPQEFGTYRYFINNPEEVWQYTFHRKGILDKAIPNQAHHSIVDIEHILKDRFHLITQNVDGLHLKAGTSPDRYFEIHGNVREVRCSKECSKDIYPIPKVPYKKIDEDLTPEDWEMLKCPKCGAVVRMNVLWFDEYYNERIFRKDSSMRVAKNTAILFIVGTSGATNLPMRIADSAARVGAYLVDLNLEDNQFTRRFGHLKRFLKIRGNTSEVLPALTALIREEMN